MEDNQYGELVFEELGLNLQKLRKMQTGKRFCQSDIYLLGM